MKLLLKNPIYLMQCVLPAVLMPVIMGIYILSAISLENTTNVIEEISEFNTTVACTILGIMHFFSMMIYIAVTAISRDGQSAKFMKYIPVPLYKQIRYKIIPSVVINIISILMCGGAAVYLYRNNILEIVIISMIATILSVIESYAMIIIDLKKPKLEWDTEYAVVKQNINMIFQIIFVLIVLGGIVYLAQVLETLNVWFSLLIIFAIFSMVVVIIDKIIKKNENKLFKKIN